MTDLEPTMADAEPETTDPRLAAADVDPDAVRRRIERRAAAITRRELDRAFARLESRGEVTDDQRAVVVELAAAITAGVLAGPGTALEYANDHDPEAVRTALELFGGER